MMIDPSDEVKYTWRYQIVANKMCQIGVDKLDYIRRDCYHLGIKINDTFTRLITKARVGDANVFSEIRTNRDPYEWLPNWVPPAGEVFKANIYV